MGLRDRIIKKSLPYLLIFLMCAFIVAITECSEIAIKKFKYPFILRYINTIQQIALYLIIPIWRCCKLQRSISQQSPNKNNKRIGANYNHSGINYKSSQKSINNNPMNIKFNIIATDRDFNDKHQFWFLFYTLWGAISTSSAGMILNVGLEHISVPTATAMSSFRAVFTLTLSVMFLQFPLKLWSITAVIVSSIGMLLYVMEVSDNEDNNNHNDGDEHDTIYGCFLVLIANLLFAINDIICKKAANYCYERGRMIMGNILYVIYTSLITLPLFIWVIWVPRNIWKDTDPMDWNTVFWIAVNGIMLIGVHLTGYFAITLKSPMYVALGFLLATPMAFVTDVLLHHYTPSYLCVLGAMLLLLGFLMLEIIQPSQILCPFCDKILMNKGDDIDDWNENDGGSDDFEKKCRLTDSFDDEYGYKHNKVLNKNSYKEPKIYKNGVKNIMGKNNKNNKNISNDKYNNLNDTGSGNSSDDIHEPMLAVLQSGGTYTSTIPSNHDYTRDDLADISFDVDGNKTD